MRLFTAILKALVQVAVWLIVMAALYLGVIWLLLLGLRFWGASI